MLSFLSKTRQLSSSTTKSEVDLDVSGKSAYVYTGGGSSVQIPGDTTRLRVDKSVKRKFSLYNNICCASYVYPDMHMCVLLHIVDTYMLSRYFCWNFIYHLQILMVVSIMAIYFQWNFLKQLFQWMST